MITYCPPLPTTTVPVEDRHCVAFPTVEAFQRWLVQEGIILKHCPADWRWP
jgi:hypothetical protein